jgi:polar amino acid transport system substrate-binding protein
MSYDLGAELAKRLGVPVDYVRYQRVADIVTAIKDGQIDFTVTNATPARRSVSRRATAAKLRYA